MVGFRAYKRGRRPLPVDTGGIWTPFNLGGQLLGFWDADYGVTQTANLVSAWADRVAGYSVVQATGSVQPVLSATGLNSRNAIVFDGADDNLGMASNPFPTGSTGTEIWALCGWTGAGVLGGITGYGGTTPTTSRVTRHSAANSAQAAASDGTSNVVATDPATTFTGNHVVRGRFEPTQVLVSMDNDGPTAAAVSLNTTGSTVVKIGCNTGTAAFWAGPIAVVIVTSLLSTSDATQMYQYLKARGGTP